MVLLATTILALIHFPSNGLPLHYLTDFPISLAEAAEKSPKRYRSLLQECELHTCTPLAAFNRRCHQFDHTS